MRVSGRRTGRQRTGSAGESIAEAFLREKGYTIIDRNWRCAVGEIDLVAIDGEYLAFVEVKTRRSSIAGSAVEAVTSAKGQRLLAAAEWFIAEHPAYGELIWRIDLVAISQSQTGSVERIDHIQNAILSE